MHATPPCIRPIRRAAHLANPLAVGSLIGTRTECIRERAAQRPRVARNLQALFAEARIPKGSGPFPFLTSTGLRVGADRRSMDRTTGDGGRSLTTCCGTTSVLADGLPRNFCGCSSAGRARPRHGRGHEFETRHPLHFGCVLSLRCRVTWCWRRGMCATQGLSHVQRDTTSDGMLAFGHSRSGNTRPS